jgi:hypothetical protein
MKTFDDFLNEGSGDLSDKVSKFMKDVIGENDEIFKKFMKKNDMNPADLSDFKASVLKKLK